MQTETSRILTLGSEAPDFSPTALRKTVLTMAYHGKTVHVPCAFSIIEMVSVLYSKHLRYNRSDPRDPSRDYLVLSKGHGVMAFYAAFAALGWISREDIEGYFTDGSLLHGLSESRTPGLEVTSGSLGHGLPIAAGLALGLLRNKETRRVYCIAGDGEMNEGPMWESLLFAAHHKLGNLTLLIDANGYQAMGKTDEVLGLEPLPEKLTAFGWTTVEIDGHSLSELDCELTRIRELDSLNAKPQAIIARTVKGKGVSFMEHENHWHYTRLDDAAFANATAELGGNQ
jgi:transketolase